MKKVFIIHGLDSSPNGGWRPWLMAELKKLGVYACALSMPEPERPTREDWIAEIARYAERDRGDELYLVGHSLGASAVLRYLETAPRAVAGAVLVSGRCEPTSDPEVAGFFDSPFDFPAIKAKADAFAVIHGDDDPVVPFRNAEIISEALGARLTIVKGGRHLNGESGWYALPQCLDALREMMR